MTSVGPDVLFHPTFTTPVPESSQAEILLTLILADTFPAAEVAGLCLIEFITGSPALGGEGK